MQNQPNLIQYRAEIDLIDEQILELLKQRMDVVSVVAHLKRQNNEKFFISSSREADMIKNLLQKADVRFRKSAIIDIWRKIIASANVLEQRIKVGIFNPNNTPDYIYIARKYYGDFVEIVSYANLEELMFEVDEGGVQIVAFADKSEDFLTRLISGGVKVFAQIPFLVENTTSNICLFLAANKEAEESSKDRSLFLIKDVADAAVLWKLLLKLSELDLNVRVLNFKDEACLMEVDGFFMQNNDKIVDLKQAGFEVIVVGNFPA